MSGKGALPTSDNIIYLFEFNVRLLSEITYISDIQFAFFSIVRIAYEVFIV